MTRRRGGIGELRPWLFTNTVLPAYLALLGAPVWARWRGMTVARFGHRPTAPSRPYNDPIIFSRCAALPPNPSCAWQFAAAGNWLSGRTETAHVQLTGITW